MLAAVLMILLAVEPPWPDGKELVLEAGTQRVIRVPGVQRIAVTSASMYEASPTSDGLSIRAVTTGRTTILVWLTNGRRMSIPLRVVEHIDTPTPVSVKVRDGGVSSSNVSVFELPVALTEVHEVSSDDGGVSLVGTDATGARYDLELRPTTAAPRRSSR